ncbi:hypothetical protein [Flavobacterium sp. XGLA_31]|uniref:hypothetical protein n=1 Tax=Flavobacterium sp. XGLA_31 TaxID=3447666 RepID=UPI003F368B8F
MKNLTLRCLKVAVPVVLLLSLLSCRKTETAAPVSLRDTAVPDSLSEEEQQTFHQDSSYQYEYRTGTSGDYHYTYDISGTDSNGDSVHGTVTMDGKTGTGTITTMGGDEIDVEVEWTGKGILTGTDAEGNSYDLEVD